MSPQILGNLTSLSQKVQQVYNQTLQARQMAANNAKAIAELQGQVGGLAGSSGVGGGWVPILTTPATALIHTGAATAWGPLSVSLIVPSSASWVLLSGYAYFSTPDNADVELDFRRDSTDQARRVACRYRSVNGSYSGNAAINIAVPVSKSGTIDYQIINGSFTTLTVNIVAYQ